MRESFKALLRTLEDAGRSVRALRSVQSVRSARGSARRAFHIPLILRVRGYSMAPTFLPGDWLWVDTNTTVFPRPHEVVVVRHPKKERQILVKRVRSCGRSTYSVGSDNPADAQDSRHFGSLHETHFVGRVRYSWPVRSR